MEWNNNHLYKTELFKNNWCTLFVQYVIDCGLVTLEVVLHSDADLVSKHSMGGFAQLCKNLYVYKLVQG